MLIFQHFRLFEKHYIILKFMEERMEIIEITKRTPSLIEQLVVVWEKSIKATHLFLSAGEVEEIKNMSPRL